MFSKDNKAKNRVTAPPSLISTDLIISGNLSSTGDMQVDGTVDGDVTSQTLTIGERATINGEVVAESLVVHGRIVGRIRARHVDLKKTAYIDGDIWNNSIAIEAGAYLEGHLHHFDGNVSEDIQDLTSAKIDGPSASSKAVPLLNRGNAEDETEPKAAAS